MDQNTSIQTFWYKPDFSGMNNNPIERTLKGPGNLLNMLESGWDIVSVTQSSMEDKIVVTVILKRAIRIQG